MTTEELIALLEKCDREMTPGEWEFFAGSLLPDEDHRGHSDDNDWIEWINNGHSYQNRDADGEGFADLRNNAAAIAAALRRLTQERDAWKNAVIDAAVVNWTLSGDDETNPVGAVNKLICHAVDLERHELREQVKTLTQERDAARAEVADLQQESRDEDSECHKSFVWPSGTPPLPALRRWKTK